MAIKIILGFLGQNMQFSSIVGGTMPATESAAVPFFDSVASPQIFAYTSCPVCASNHVYKTAQGHERCRDCDRPYAFSSFASRSSFALDDGRETLCLPGRVV